MLDITLKNSTDFDTYKIFENEKIADNNLLMGLRRYAWNYQLFRQSRASVIRTQITPFFVIIFQSRAT